MSLLHSFLRLCKNDTPHIKFWISNVAFDRVKEGLNKNTFQHLSPISSHSFLIYCTSETDFLNIFGGAASQNIGLPVRLPACPPVCSS